MSLQLKKTAYSSLLLKFIAVTLLPAVLSIFCKPKEPSIEELGKQFAEYYKSIPELKKLPTNRNYRLKVRYLVDKDLPKFTAKELNQVLKQTSIYAKEYLGYKVDFQVIEYGDIFEFFEKNKKKFDTAPFSYPPKSWYIEPKAKDTWQQSRKAIEKALKSKKDEIVFSYFGKPMDLKAGKYDRNKYIDQVTDTFMGRMNGILSEIDLVHRPLYAHKRKFMFSFAHWDAIAYQEKKADIIIFNGLMVGPDTDMPLYVINRGGITSAFIENNLHRPYQGVGIFGTYQFLSSGDYFTKKRGKYTHDEAKDVAAMMWVHELGHLLKRKVENYTLDGSVHKAPIDIDYLSWAKQVKAKHKSINYALKDLKRF